MPALLREFRYDPNQPRDREGQWTRIGAALPGDILISPPKNPLGQDTRAEIESVETVPNVGSSSAKDSVVVKLKGGGTRVADADDVVRLVKADTGGPAGWPKAGDTVKMTNPMMPGLSNLRAEVLGYEGDRVRLRWPDGTENLQHPGRMRDEMGKPFPGALDVPSSESRSPLSELDDAKRRTKEAREALGVARGSWPKDSARIAAAKRAVADAERAEKGILAEDGLPVDFGARIEALAKKKIPALKKEIAALDPRYTLDGIDSRLDAMDRVASDEPHRWGEEEEAESEALRIIRRAHVKTLAPTIKDVTPAAGGVMGKPLKKLEIREKGEVVGSIEQTSRVVSLGGSRRDYVTTWKVRYRGQSYDAPTQAAARDWVKRQFALEYERNGETYSESDTSGDMPAFAHSDALELLALAAAGETVETLPFEDERAFVDAVGPELLDWLDLTDDATAADVFDAVEHGVLLSDAEMDEYVEAIVELGAANASPADREKLKGLIAHYRKKPHPFTACVRDNTKRFGSEGAKRICATLKDIMTGTTKWRKGGKKRLADDLEVSEEFTEWLAGVDLTAREFASDDDLPTVDIEGVEILSAGGPYFGTGSPKDGDHFDKAYLERIAANSRELAAEVKAPNKLGHGKEQNLLRASGLLSDDEMPAAGFVDPTTLAIEKGDDGRWKMKGTLRGVPRKFAKLIKSGAFPRRSAELARIKSQTLKEEDGSAKVYDGVLTGLAWLGAKRPAIRTLDDVLALYSDGEETAEALLALDESGDAAVYVDATLDPPDLKVDGKPRYVDLADDSWNPGEGLEWLRSRVALALNPSGQASLDGGESFYVRDVAPAKALVARYRGGGEECYVVGYRLDGDTALLEPADEWTKVEQSWTAIPAPSYSYATADGRSITLTLTGYAGDATKASAALRRVLATRGDTSGEMPETKTPIEFSDEQIVALAETLGVEESDDGKRRELVLAKLSEALPAADPDPDPEKPDPEKPDPETPAPGVSLSEAEVEVLKANAAAGAKVAEERKVEKRDDDIKLAQREGRIDLSDEKKTFWETQYGELGYERAHSLLFQMPVNDEFVKVYGEDDDLADPETRGTSEDAAYRAYMEGLGYDVADLPTVPQGSAA